MTTAEKKLAKRVLTRTLQWVQGRAFASPADRRQAVLQILGLAAVAFECYDSPPNVTQGANHLIDACAPHQARMDVALALSTALSAATALPADAF